MAVTVDHHTSVGPRVRALRDQAGLSLRDLADRSGVSAPMLSQVERAETSPTLAVATKIAHGLGLSLSALLRLDEADTVVVIPKAKRRRTRRDGHRFEELTPSALGQSAEVSVHYLAPGSRTAGPNDPPRHAPGSRETAVVQSGRLVLAIDGRNHELTEGDAVTFEADLPHHFLNPTGREVSFLAVVTAGLRR